MYCSSMYTTGQKFKATLRFKKKNIINTLFVVQFIAKEMTKIHKINKNLSTSKHFEVISGSDLISSK
ncbi:hypothetical protein LDENG_00006670 [Lucifuga dentata]|nr:hypothetical protein LDENG_00006670 [Lucifuga dentata]